MYAQTDNRDSDTEEGLYAPLQELPDRAPRGDMVVVLCDFSARVGNDVEEWNNVIGKHGEVVKKKLGPGHSCLVQKVNSAPILNIRKSMFTWKHPGRGL